MAHNILLTGGAGFIGGTVLAELVAKTSGPIKSATIIVPVRSEDQVQKLSKLDVKAILLDLGDAVAIKKVVIENEVDLVIHVASSMVPSFAAHLIEALGERRKATGAAVHFIHSSVTAAFSQEGGWPAGEVRDTDDVFATEKQLGGPHPVRVVDLLVLEEARKHDVAAYLVVVPGVYGTGSGEGRKISSAIPAFVRTSIKAKAVYKFANNKRTPAVHVADISQLYAILAEKILQQESIPTGQQGYYFAIAHKFSWWELMDRLAEFLHKRGLVEDSQVREWPSYELAATSLGWPREYVQNMGESGGQQIPINAKKLGWEPRWGEKEFLDSIDDEIQAVLDFDTYKHSLYDSMLAAEK